MSAPDGLTERFQWFLSDEGRAQPMERDARLGEIAVREGYLSRERLDECLRAGAGRPVLEVAREKGLLTPSQLEAILDIERVVSAETDTSSTPTAAGSLPGRRRIGRFRLLELLGEGGMGLVFRARDDELGRDVALKMLKTVQSYSAAQVERFQREARSAARLKHPGIVTIHEVGREGDALYYTMELVEGRPFNELEGDLDARVRILEKAARAVQYAHEQGVVHRDLKPPNILVDGQGRPRVLDFGLSRDLQSTSDLSRTGALLGTPHYMSPEQAEGRVHEVDARADVYALGVMLYESLAGRVPFGGSTVAEVVQRSLAEDPKPPKGPAALVAICLKAIEKDPGRRFATAAEFADDLARYLAGKRVRAHLPGLLRRVRRWGRRPVPLLATVGIAVVAIGAWRLVGRSASPPAPPPAAATPGVLDRWKGAANLLARIDPAKDADSGVWKLERGELLSDGSQHAKIQVPYLLPLEYEARFVFTNRERDGMVACILSRTGRSFAFVMDPKELRTSGFEISGLSGTWEAAPSTHAANALAPGRRHELIVGVGSNRVTVSLDGRRIGTYQVAGDAGRLTGAWSLKDKRVPGLGSSAGAAVFHSLDLIEVLGRGRPTRE